MNYEEYDEVFKDIIFLEIIGHDFVHSALLLFKTNRSVQLLDYICSFNLLATQALEILPKSLIAIRVCLENNNMSKEKMRNTINKKSGSFNHGLDNIFDKVPELKRSLNISSIERHKSKFIDEFHFTVAEKIIKIKSLEGARYGVFARNANYSFSCDENIVNFLKKISENTEKIRVNMINEFNGKHKKIYNKINLCE